MIERFRHDKICSRVQQVLSAENGLINLNLPQCLKLCLKHWGLKEA
jgi:hypothetical protein